MFIDYRVSLCLYMFIRKSEVKWSLHGDTTPTVIDIQYISLPLNPLATRSATMTLFTLHCTYVVFN